MTESVASSITKAASKQTYYTVRLLVDRDRVEDAYCAYGYFRWVDDALDGDSGTHTARIAFLERQKSLLDMCYRGLPPQGVNDQEKILVELIARDQERNSGLQIYLRNMMQVMDFDARRRGRLISQVELNEYTRWLATAVTECIHHFIGHDQYAPRDAARYLAVSAAHIIHMLRDTFDDVPLGYYNIPREVLEADHIAPLDIENPAYRAWVKSRVQLACEYFKAGKQYFSRVQSTRCRLACFAYIARFDWMMETLKSERYCLRPQYNERKSMGMGLRMIRHALVSTFGLNGEETISHPIASQQPGKVWNQNQ